MFSRQHRLKRKSDIERVFKSGKSVFDKVNGIKMIKNSLPESRFTVVVGLKVSKSAVKRNRVKRQYREILRLRMTEVTPGYDVMVLISKSALELTYEEKEKGFVRVLKKAGLLSK